jgi:Domain of unknown function (DUF4249)
MKYILVLLATGFLFLQACSEDFFSQTVNIDPPPYDKQLSFHLNLTTEDSILKLVMTRNYGILEDVNRFEDWFVTGATVDIYENGQKWCTFGPANVDSGYQMTAVLPSDFVPGSTYEIRATHPDFPATRAVQIMPEPLNIDSVSIKYDAVPGEFGDRLNLLEVSIRDQPGVKNYYEVTLFGKSLVVLYNPNGQLDTVGLQRYSLYVEGYNDPNVVEGFDGGGLLSDQFFDGQTYKFQARFYASSYYLADSTINVRVRSVTEDYFKWSRSYQAYYDSEGNPLVEPISVFHNLENGLGIFSLAQEKNYYFKK